MSVAKHRARKCWCGAEFSGPFALAMLRLHQRTDHPRLR